MAQVTIIGASFAGMTLALFLKQRNISSVIYESEEESFHPGGTVGLAPNAIRVLDHAGVYEGIRPKGYQFEELNVVDGQGRTLAMIFGGSQQLFNYKGLRIHRSFIREEIRAELKKQRIRVHYGKKFKSVVNIDEAQGLVQVEFEDGEKVTSNFVIGADGINSTVREYIAPGSGDRLVFDGTVGLGSSVMKNELKGVDWNAFDIPAFVLGDYGAFGIAPASPEGDDVQYFASFELPEKDREGWAKLANDPQALYKTLADRFSNNKQPDIVRAMVEQPEATRLGMWPFYSVPQDSKWYDASRRVILIGDSAHAIPPHGGQGAAMALEDSEALSYALASVFGTETSTPDEYRAIVEKWESHRRERVEKITAFTNGNGKMRRTRGTVEGIAKEWTMWASFNWYGKGGPGWIYGYTAESMRSALATI